MGDLPITYIVVLFVLILLSAFFSAIETAFSSVNKIRLKNYVDEKRKGAKKALYISDNFDKALATILVGNNVVNIAAASISTKVATDIFGSQGIVISTFVMTILILIFGEILPKSFAKEYAESFSLTVSGGLLFLMKILTPVTFIFISIKNAVSKVGKKQESMPSVTEEEIKVMVGISEEEGVIDNHEAELVQRSLDFNDIHVGEILTPRIDMISVEVNQAIEEVKEIFFEERFSRIPVYKDNIDNVIGILSEREFLSELVKNGTVNIEHLLRDPYFVVESMKISTLLPELQKNKVHMAIVVDEFGGTSGIITMEDILEELVGDIWDEHDEKIRHITQLEEDEFELNADMPLDEFANLFDLDEPGSNYNSVGGWIFEEFERIPTEGEVFDFEHLTIRVITVENRRIRKIHVHVHPFKDEDSLE